MVVKGVVGVSSHGVGVRCSDGECIGGRNWWGGIEIKAKLLQNEN